MSEAASLVKCTYSVEEAIKYCFCAEDPMHLLPVPDLFIMNGLD